MSLIGKKPILIPPGVEVKTEGQKVIISGPKGILIREIRPEVGLAIENNQIKVSPRLETKKSKAFWGLTRALINSMVKGVAEGYEKKLEIEGLGYKAFLEGNNLVLKVGFTHPIRIECPEGIKFLVEKNIITVSGANKETVSQIAAKIRAVQPPEPYKGKGIRYLGEKIRKKIGKKAVTATK